MKEVFNETDEYYDMRLKILALTSENQMLKDSVDYLSSELDRLKKIVKTIESIDSF